MLFLLMVLVLGFWTKQDARYWKFAFCAFALQLLATVLFKARGTLENPAADGFITALVRRATNDGAEVAWLMPLAIAIGWGVPIYLIYKGYKRQENPAVNKH